MEILRHVLLVIHLLGFAALFGGLFIQMSSATKSVNSAMRDGAGTAFVAGLLLVGVLEGTDGVEVNHMKVGIKLLIGLVILVLVMVNMKKPQIPNGLFWGIFGLTVVNVAVAVFVSSSHAVA